jgi:tetratricopeptide (TPR) repeat protein
VRPINRIGVLTISTAANNAVNCFLKGSRGEPRMTTQTQDTKTALDAIEEDVDLGRTDADVLLPKLATLLLSLQGDSPLRPRVHRLLGAVHNRLRLDRDALRELGEAKALAESAKAPNYRELAKIGRETAEVYAGRGDVKRADGALVTALAFAALEGDQREVARIVVALGRIAFEAQRFDTAARLYRSLVLHGAALPPRELQRVRIDLCQALNRLGAHDEALQHIATLQAELPESEKRLRLLTRLEEARAYGRRGQFDAAEQALREAEKSLPAKDSAFERSEFIQAVTELQEAKGGPPAVKSLEHLIESYAKQRLVVQEAVARRALANALFRQGQDDRAREALAQGLRSALRYDLVEVADEIRAELLKSAGAERLENLTEAIDLIGGGAIGRRFVGLDRLGKEGAAAESLAIDLTDGRHVTLKTVDLSGLSEAQRQAVMSAVKTDYGEAGRLNDPRVARVLDLRLTPDGILYVVQRYVPGPTLRELYATGAGPKRLVELLAGVADALAVLHGKGIVHRDLKPETVVVVRDARGLEWPVLIDLGIALTAGQKDKPKSFGTPPYVAPEQAAGRPVDWRADIYALGQMIAEVWGGKVPPRFTLGMLRRGNAPAPMPRAIHDLVRGMVQQNPEDRTSDLAGIAQTLRTQSQQALR